MSDTPEPPSETAQPTPKRTPLPGCVVRSSLFAAAVFGTIFAVETVVWLYWGQPTARVNEAKLFWLLTVGYREVNGELPGSGQPLYKFSSAWRAELLPSLQAWQQGAPIGTSGEEQFELAAKAWEIRKTSAAEQISPRIRQELVAALGRIAAVVQPDGTWLEENPRFALQPGEVGPDPIQLFHTADSPHIPHHHDVVVDISQGRFALFLLDPAGNMTPLPPASLSGLRYLRRSGETDVLPAALTEEVAQKQILGEFED